MRRLNTDAVLAFCIGALVGVGAALLLESGDDRNDGDVAHLLRKLRRKGVRARIMSPRAARRLQAAIAAARRVRVRH